MSVAMRPKKRREREWERDGNANYGSKQQAFN